MGTGEPAPAYWVFVATSNIVSLIAAVLLGRRVQHHDNWISLWISRIAVATGAWFVAMWAMIWLGFAALVLVSRLD
jgi:hypothetical protein